MMADTIGLTSGRVRLASARVKYLRATADNVTAGGATTSRPRPATGPSYAGATPIPPMSSGWGMKPTTRRFWAPTTMVGRVWAALGPKRPIGDPASSGAGVATGVSRPAGA